MNNVPMIMSVTKAVAPFHIQSIGEADIFLYI